MEKKTVVVCNSLQVSYSGKVSSVLNSLDLNESIYLQLITDSFTMGDDNNNVKVMGIRQIVRLKEILKKWHSVTLCQKDNQGATSSSSFGIPLSVSKQLKNLSLNWDSDDDEGCMSSRIPKDVPKGYVPVYVGLEHRRFIIPTSYLGKPMFKLLLEKAEEEFGFDHEGALTIPCEIETFKYILQFMDRHQNGLIDDEGNPTGLEE